MKRLVPFKTCPFRTDVPFYLHPKRAEEIVRSLTVPDRSGRRQSFMCHATLDYTHEDEGEDGCSYPRATVDSRWCNGALIVMAKQGILHTNEMARLAIILGILDPAQLDLTVPVPDSLPAWVAFQKKLDRGSSSPAAPAERRKIAGRVRRAPTKRKRTS